MRCPRILDCWDRYLSLFWKVSPRSLTYKVDGHVADKSEARAGQPDPSPSRSSR